MLWHVGAPGVTPREDGAFRGRSTVTFHVGTDDPADFPRRHPGPLDASHGFAPASLVIEFDAPAGSQERWHELLLEAAASHGPCPQLAVEIGGRRGLIVPRVRRDDRTVPPIPPSPIAGQVHEALALPPGAVREGRNRLTITTAAVEPASPEEAVAPRLPPLAEWFGSALSWQRLQLRRGGQMTPRAILTATPFRRRDGAGERLRIDVLLRDAPAVRRVELTVGSTSTGFDVEPHDFGCVHRPVWVPDLHGEVDAQLVAHAGDVPLLVHRERLRVPRHWTLHLIPHSHLDVGYTDLQAKTLELHHRNVDRALDLISGQPAFRYTVDGTLVIDGYRRSRSAARTRELDEALASGHIAVNAFSSLPLTGVTALETMYRAAMRGPRHHRTSWLTDVPSYTGALPSILAALGLADFVGIQNHFHGGNADSDDLHLRSPLRWRGPDGSEVLTAFADGYAQLRIIAGEPPTVVGATQSFGRLIARYEHEEYLPDHLPIVGTHNDNEDLSDGYDDFVGRWEATYTWPRLRFSTLPAYMDAIRPLRDRLPIVEGDGGSYWEDGVGANARAAAALARSQALLPAAEGLCALLSWHDTRLVPDVEALDRCWAHVLLGVEHTWSSAHATSRPHAEATRDQTSWKVAEVAEALRGATDLSRQALSQLGDLVTLDRPAAIVVNPLSWPRDVEVELELEADTLVYDQHGAELATFRRPAVDGVERTVVLVPEVPSFGFRTLRVRRDPSAAPAGDALGPPAVSAPPEPAGARLESVARVLHTAHYEVTVDERGPGLAGLRHRTSGRQLVDGHSGWRLGDVLRVTGGGTDRGRGLGGEATTLNDASAGSAPALDVTIARGEVLGLERRPWGVVLLAEAQAPSVSARWTWSFPHFADHVDLEVTLTKEPVLAKESVYVAFPFAATSPSVRFDRHQGWIEPATDLLPGACAEWFTPSSWLAVSDDLGTVAWASPDAPLVALDDVVRGRWPRGVAPQTGTVLSWVMNNHWPTNTPPSQSGTVVLRYRFRPLPSFDAVACARLGRSAAVPPLVGTVSHNDRGDAEPRRLPSDGRLLDIDVPANVELTVLVPRRRPGLLLRLRELAGSRTELTLPWPADGTVRRCRADETELEPPQRERDGSAHVAVPAFGVVTVHLSRERPR